MKKMWRSEKVHGDSDITKNWNLKCKHRKHDGNNNTQKKYKNKNPKLKPESNFWKMLIPIPILNLNLNWPNQIWLSPLKRKSKVWFLGEFPSDLKLRVGSYVNSCTSQFFNSSYF
jgi:hypothetical protein